MIFPTHLQSDVDLAAIPGHAGQDLAQVSTHSHALAFAGVVHGLAGAGDGKAFTHDPQANRVAVQAHGARPELDVRAHVAAVDDLGVIVRTEQRGDAWLVDVVLPVALRPLMVAHGSITVNGVSLTVNALLEDGVQLSIIEYTKRHTTLGELVAGDRVHVEADVLAKHVERLLTPWRSAGVEVA